MNLNIKISLIVFLSILCENTFCQINHFNVNNQICDSITINAVEIHSIDVRFQIALEYHIEYLNSHFSSRNKKKYIIWSKIDINNSYINDSTKKYLLSQYEFARFGKSDFDQYYFVTFEIIRKTNRKNFRYSGYNKYFYCNFDGWDLIFTTDLPITFQDSIGIKTIHLSILEDKITKGINGVSTGYTITNNFIIQKTGNVIFESGTDFDSYEVPYLYSNCSTRKVLSTKKIKKIKSKLNNAK
jgi:hypothetical protein